LLVALWVIALRLDIDNASKASAREGKMVRNRQMTRQGGALQAICAIAKLNSEGREA
jgi:hypothetical protein